MAFPFTDSRFVAAHHGRRFVQAERNIEPRRALAEALDANHACPRRTDATIRFVNRMSNLGRDRAAAMSMLLHAHNINMMRKNPDARTTGNMLSEAILYAV